MSDLNVHPVCRESIAEKARNARQFVVERSLGSGPAGPQQAPAGPQQAPAGPQQAPAGPQQAPAGSSGH